MMIYGFRAPGFGVIQLAMLVVAFATLLQSCIHIHRPPLDRSSSESDAVTSTAPRDTTYTAQMGNVSAVAGPVEPIAVKRLSRIGDKVSIGDNDEVRLSFQGFDPKKCVLVTEYDPVLQQTTIIVVDRSSFIVTFKEKCQVIRVGNVSTLPRVVIANSLDAEQIVITPLCDGQKTIVGYEYRYGSQESGCRSQAKAGIAEWQRCKGAQPPKQRLVKVSDKEASTIYFGL